MTRIVMVMPYADHPPKARERGFDICAIWDPRAAERIFGDGAGRYLAQLGESADELRLTDFDDLAGFERALRSAVADYRPAYLYHVGSEDTMLTTYRVAEDLGLSVNPARAIQVINDKLELRRLLARRGLSPVRFEYADRWRDVAPLLAGFSLPVVVKPARLSGSRGVLLLRDPGELEGWGSLLDAYDYAGPVLVEEYLSGPEFSVETISVRGQHHVVGVTSKLVGPPPFFVETGHVHPAPSSASADAMSRLVVDMLTGCGYRTGPAHTEVRLTPGGPRIVESQARHGGDNIPRLMALSTGFDTAGAIYDALAGVPPRPGQGTGTAQIHYFSLPPGVLVSVTGIEDLRSLEFVHELRFPFRPGDTIPATVDWRTRHGYVIVCGQSAEHTRRLVDQVVAGLHVRVETGGDWHRSGGGQCAPGGAA
jgi:biotin carboxylase